MTLTLLVILVLVVQAAALVGIAVNHWRYRIDYGRIADQFAAVLLEEFEPNELSEDGAHRWCIERYGRLAATFGLPSAPSDAIARRCWQRIAAAQGAQPQRVEADALYG